jgi:DNA helicase HerA-like ATPase
MQNFDKIIKAENKNAVLPIIQNDEYLPQHPFRALINGASGSGKSNLLLNLMFDKNFSLNFHKVYLYARDLTEDKYQFVINKMNEIKDVNDGDNFEMGSSIEDVVDVDSLDKDKMNLIIFDDFITTKDQSKISELFIRGRKKNASIIYLSQAYHTVPPIIRKNLNYVAFFKATTKREISTLSVDYATDIDKADFQKLYVKATSIPHNFLFIDLKTPNKSMKYRSGFLGFSNWTDEK